MRNAKHDWTSRPCKAASDFRPFRTDKQLAANETPPGWPRLVNQVGRLKTKSPAPVKDPTELASVGESGCKVKRDRTGSCPTSFTAGASPAGSGRIFERGVSGSASFTGRDKPGGVYALGFGHASRSTHFQDCPICVLANSARMCFNVNKRILPADRGARGGRDLARAVGRDPKEGIMLCIILEKPLLSRRCQCEQLDSASHNSALMRPWPSASEGGRPRKSRGKMVQFVRLQIPRGCASICT